MTENENVELYESFKNKMYVTYSARFNAEQRLRKQHSLSYFSTMMLAVYIISLTLSSNFNPANFINSDYLALVSVILSVLLLGIMGLEYGNNRIERAVRFHQNAMKLEALYNSYQFIERTSENIEKISNKYDELIESCPFNHEIIDYYEVQKRNSKSEGDRDKYARLYSKLCFKQNLIYYAVIVIPPIIYFGVMKSYFYLIFKFFGFI